MNHNKIQQDKQLKYWMKINFDDRDINIDKDPLNCEWLTIVTTTIGYDSIGQHILNYIWEENGKEK